MSDLIKAGWQLFLLREAGEQIIGTGANLFSWPAGIHHGPTTSLVQDWYCQVLKLSLRKAGGGGAAQMDGR